MESLILREDYCVITRGGDKPGYNGAKGVWESGSDSPPNDRDGGRRKLARPERDAQKQDRF